MLIGDFARLGQVSVRMLRHYDAIGLLTPARVDPWTGYRTYAPEQLGALNRIVALRDLGFGLDAIGEIVAGGIDAGQLQAMLRLRQAQIEEDVRVASTRLAAVESRLRMIEKEKTVPVDLVLKTLPAQRVAGIRATMTHEEFVPRIGEMFGRVADLLAPTGISLETSVATYDEREAGVDVFTGHPVPDSVAGALPDGLVFVDLPGGRAACGVHLGEMASIGESWQELYRATLDGGHTPAGPCREVYLRSHPHPQSDWVTELQQPVAD
ncbi:MerR family transcriptional regulator [Mobilicoccus sp.]|uniref:MerR family transcriptional regulator n=1 Tax=Mobilicoccus sp. TaxID=2034349 RepID=UPI00289C92D1|nr:MerR family transcriptional regulator [Mobilicoccus sp.]